MENSKGNVKFWALTFIIGFLGSLCATLIIDYFIPILQQRVVWNIVPLYVLIFLLFFILSVFLWFIVTLYYSRKHGQTGRWWVYTVDRRPDTVLREFTVPKFGVIWKGVIGTVGILLSQPYAYVDGAYCPKCNVELMGREKKKSLSRKSSYIWECPNCGFEKERPEDYLYREKEAIKKIAMAEYRKQEKGGY